MRAWNLEVLSNSLVLSLEEMEVPLESGDFNGDSVVNLADYAVWRGNLGAGDGTPGSLSVGDGDANGDGLVDSQDYAIWKLQFGMVPAAAATLTSAGVAAVPEPSSTSVLLLGMWALASARVRPPAATTGTR
jgi:hypothetical protein